MLSSSCRPTNSLARQFHRAFHDKRWPGWQVIVGIETHAQIKSRQKLFSESSTSSLGEAPNIHVSPFDAAFPGTLPKLNQDCVDLALRTAIALNSQIQTRSSFDRKHYFYSDLPSGYQITQHYAPISLSGHLRIPNRETPIRIMQIQLEQDTAKSTFDPRTRTSNIDLNRAGIGLLEIVTEPDLRSPEEAGAYVRALQAVLRAIGASDGNMEAGSLRCDVNVSINPIGKPPGTRCEIKNLNSIKFMQTAIVYEVNRQRDLLSKEGGVVPQETRGFNQDTLETFKMRSKEEAPDYRYMPDPNLGVLVISPDRVRDITQKMPELPWVTRTRLVRECKLSEQDADILLNLDAGRDGRSAVAYFDDLCKESRKPTVVFNWMVHELLGRLHTARLTFADNPLSTSQLGELIDFVQSGALTGTSGKLLLREMLVRPSSQTPTERALTLDLLATNQEQDLNQVCAAAITALPSEAEAYRRGHKNVLNKILGWVMKETRGRADSKQAREQLLSLLERDAEP